MCLSRAALLAIALALHGCAQHAQTDVLLNRGFMRQQFPGVRAPDLVAGSRCPESFAVSVRIVEPRPHLYMAMLPTPLFVDGPQYESMIKRYLEDSLRESRMRVQPTDGTPILVKVQDATVNTGWGPSAATLTLGISMPDLGYSAQIVGRETSGIIARSIAYAVHEAVFGFLGDSDAQSRLRCENGSGRQAQLAPQDPAARTPPPAVQPVLAGELAAAPPPAPTPRRTEGPRQVGQESYQVARMAEVKACNANPDPVLISKSGSALETYAIACTAGSAIVVNCEWGVCRVAR